MQLKRHVFYPLVFLLALVLTAEAEQGAITLNFPPDNSVMEFGVLGVSLKAAKSSADLMKVKVNEKDHLEIIPDSDFECFSVPLTVGINRIDITAEKKGKLIDEIFFRVFRRSDLESIYRTPPSDFKKNYFHLNLHPECRDCHTLVPGEADRKPVTPVDFSKGPGDIGGSGSTCYSCHKAITSLPYVHGPASVWSCLSCHDPQAVPVYSVKKPDTELCFGCHIEQKKDWGSKTYIHGPVNTGNCAICHSPHASENPFNLFKATWDLCVSCHADKATGRHILVGYIYEGHPTHGRPDPLSPGKELTCASCHNPHASNYPKLWALNVETQFELCQKCHKY